MSTTPTSRTGGTPYEEVQASDEFVQLRNRFRRFVFPVTVGFLVWYFLFVLLSAYASDFMATKVIGNINIGPKVEFEPARFVFSNKTMIGVSLYDPIVLSRALDFLDKYQHQLPLDRLAASTYALEDINEAFDAAESKRDIRASIVP